MQTFARLFAGLMLTAAFTSSAVAANRPLTMTGINSRLDGMIKTQMARELQRQDPLSRVPLESTRKVRMFKLNGPDTVIDRCPCYEYVYRRASQQSAL